jgi:hypothetical protein
MSLKDFATIFFALATTSSLWACSGGSPADAKLRSAPPRGFFERVADNLTERECNVVRFTCPYGWGPAGEPCECTDPRGIVLLGRTIK